MTITVYTGPMFSGKTTRLLIDCEEAKSEGKSVVIVRPELDTRTERLMSHDGLTASDLGIPVRVMPVDWLGDGVEEFDLVAIDEAQFFTQLRTVTTVLDSEVVCAGLDMDSNGNPWMSELLSVADYVHKLKAECSVCGEAANKTFRKLTAPNANKVLLGGGDIYEARCSEHWQAGMTELCSWNA